MNGPFAGSFLRGRLIHDSETCRSDMLDVAQIAVLLFVQLYPVLFESPPTHLKHLELGEDHDQPCAPLCTRDQ